MWSRYFATAYDGHAPLTALLVAITTGFFGDTSWAVRLGSTFCHAGTAAILFRFGKALWDEERGLIATMIWITMPAIWLSSVFLTADPPLIFFSALAFFGYWRSKQVADGRSTLLFGVPFGLALLSSTSAIFLLIGVVLDALIDRPPPRALKFLGAGIVLGLVIASPMLAEGVPGLDLPDPVFAAIEIALFGPIVLIVSIWGAARFGREMRTLLLFLVPGIFCPALAAVPVTLIATRAFKEAPAWLTANLGLGIIFGFALYAFGFGLFDLPLERDPRIELQGWRRLAPEIGRQWLTMGAPTLYTLDESDRAKLMFYMTMRPGEIRLLSSVAPDKKGPLLLFAQQPRLMDPAAARFTNAEVKAALSQSRHKAPPLHAYLYELSAP